MIYEKLSLVDKAIPTGDAAYRAVIPLEKITDPELREFVTKPMATRWMGPDRHIQGYPIRHGKLYNLVCFAVSYPRRRTTGLTLSEQVMSHPDPGFTEESWTANASKKELLENFGSWDAKCLRKLVDLIPDDKVLVWQLCSHDPLPTWVMGRLVMLGDACHPMLPYVAQGGAQAIEDVAVLNLALNQVSTLQDLPVHLKAYEYARKPRAEHIMGLAGLNRDVLHYPDGPEQQERDKRFAAVSQGGENPDLLGHAEIQRLLWGFDPEKEYLDNNAGTFINSHGYRR